MKPNIYWGIKQGNMIFPFSIRSTRKQCIRDIERDYGKPWRTIRRYGCECIKVSVMEVTPMTPSDIIDRFEPDGFCFDAQPEFGGRYYRQEVDGRVIKQWKPLYTRATVEKMLAEAMKVAEGWELVPPKGTDVGR